MHGMYGGTYGHDLGWSPGPGPGDGSGPGDDADDAHDAEAVQACVRDLRTALEAHGITLPSIGVEPAAFANRPSLPLVALGNCNVRTARALAAVLRTAWRVEEPR